MNTCPMCDGAGSQLGKLSNEGMMVYMCRNCGWTWQATKHGGVNGSL